MRLVFTEAINPDGEHSTPEAHAAWVREREDKIGQEIARLTSISKRAAKRARVQYLMMSKQLMKVALTAIVDLLLAKSVQMDRAEATSKKVREWLTSDDWQNATLEEDIKQGRALQADLRGALDAAPLQLDHLQHLSPEERELLDKSADYTDEWFGIRGSQCAFRVFYVCGRKTSYGRCPTLIASSQWLRKNQDPLATKQKWYCKVCEATYKTTQGVMIQFMQNGVSSFSRAAFPDAAFQQIRFTAIQRAHQHATTPDDLLKAIPEAKIADNNFITPHPELRGVYIYDLPTFDAMAEFDWSCLLNREWLQGGA